MNSTQSTHIVNDFLTSYLHSHFIPTLQSHIKQKFILHKISTQGVQRNSKNYFPKILQEIETHLNAYPPFLYSQSNNTHLHNHNRINNKPITRQNLRPYRKSCDDMHEIQQQQSKHSKKLQRPQWLQGFRESQQSIAQFHKNLQSNQKSIKSFKQNKKKKLFLKQILKPNPVARHQRNASMGGLPKVQKLPEFGLVKLQDGQERQDEYIIKRRQKLLKQKQMEKQFENNIFTMGNESHPIVLKKQDLFSTNNTANPVLLFTTDYNGQIIEFLQEPNKTKFGPKKNTLKGKRSDKYYSTVPNSPIKNKEELGVTTKTNLKDRTENTDEQNPLKQELKIKFKVKKQNYIQPPYHAEPKNIQFDVMNSKNQKSKDLTQPSDRTDKSKFEFARATKSSRQMVQTLDQKVLMKNFQLSPGVTIHDLNKALAEDKQNGMVSMKVLTMKSIKSFKGSQGNFPTLKSLMSKKMIKDRKETATLQSVHLLRGQSVNMCTY